MGRVVSFYVSGGDIQYLCIALEDRLDDDSNGQKSLGASGFVCGRQIWLASDRWRTTRTNTSAASA